MATEHAARLHLEEKARLAADPASPVTMTYDEFMDWADEDTLAEWVDGKVEMTIPASFRHQHIGGFLYMVLRLYVEALDLGLVLQAPFQMKLPRSGREPDVLFLAREHLDRLRATRIEGPADLVVEIISPESVTRDRVTKRREYERGGVPEYWLIDPDHRTVTFHRRDTAGAYRVVPPDPSGVYRAQTVPGFWLEVAWLWRDPLPGVEATVLAIAGEAYARHLQAQLRQLGYAPEGER